MKKAATVTDNHQAIFDYVFAELKPFRKLLVKLCRVASEIHRQGWAEANAGNVSIRLGSMLKPYLEEAGFQTSFPCSEWYLVSRSGSRYRELAIHPKQALMLIGTGETEYHFPLHAKPTSEWLCHRLIHENNAGGDLSCLLHTHPTEVIALSSTDLYENHELLNKSLFDLLPELEIFLPGGIATAPYAQAGSPILAEISCNRIEDKHVLIWERHGLIVLAENPDKALDLTEVVNKAAKLFFLLSQLRQ